MWRKFILLAGAGLIVSGVVSASLPSATHGSRPAPAGQAVGQQKVGSVPRSLSSLPRLAASRPTPSVKKPRAVVKQPDVQFGAPVSVSIPMIGVNNSRIESVGITHGSACGSDAPAGCILPVGVGLVWNSTTTLPGKPGVAVLAEHDYADGAETPFWNLYKVPVGYLIRLKVASSTSTVTTLTLRVLSSAPELKTKVQEDPEVQDTVRSSNREVIFITCNPAYGMCPDATGKHACDNQIVVTQVVAASA